MSTLGYIDFEFDLPGALLDRLAQVLDSLDFAPMQPKYLASVPEEQGVYQLFLDGELVYIGKTDAEAGLHGRLERHSRKIQHRIGLDPGRVSFKAVRIYVFTAVDLETQLIGHYGGQSAVRWNGSGFGSNDPGRERDTSTYKDTHFDTVFPIDIDREIDLDLDNLTTAAEVFGALKSSLPYTFRFQGATPRSRKPHPDLVSTQVSILKEPPITAKRVIAEVVASLPKGWVATKLPSHIILYKNDSRKLRFGTRIARSP